MLQRGYFEISQWSGTAFGLNILAMVGNMIYNQRHWQNGVEILAPLAGPLQIELEEQTFQLAPGDLMVIDAGVSHTVASHTPGSAQLIFNVDNAFIRRGDAPYLWLSTVGPCAVSQDALAVQQLRRTIFDRPVRQERNENLFYHVSLNGHDVLVLDYWHPANQYPDIMNYYGLMGIYQQALRST